MQGLKHIKDVGGYIFFSPNTRGTVGRPVKIHTSLFIDFFCSVNPKTASGEMVVRDIELLRSMQSPDFRHIAVAPKVTSKNQSDQHAKNLEKIGKTLKAMTDHQDVARERAFATKNVRVFYQIDQKADQGDKYQTVYISDIMVLSKANSFQSGLYEYQRSRSANDLVPSKNLSLAGKNVCINRASETPRKAMDNAKFLTEDMNPAVFFNPLDISEDLKISKFNGRIKDSTRETIRKLENLIKANQSSNVSWCVEGEGAAVLSHALKNVPGSLDKHKFKFYNSRANLPELLKVLSDKKANLSGQFINHYGDSVALIALAGQKSTLLEQLNKLPFMPGYEQITRRYLTEQVSALCNNALSQPAVKMSGQIRGGNKTFVEALIQTHANCS